MSELGSVAETLRLARAVIEDSAHWTKGALAKPSKRSNDFNSVPVADPHAGAWCAVGAISRVDGPFESAAIIALAQVINPDDVYTCEVSARPVVIDFNDTPGRRHKEILKKFDAAIAAAEALQ